MVRMGHRFARSEATPVHDGADGPRPSMRRVIFCMLVLVLLSLCSEAWAESSAEKFAKAVDMFTANACSTALPIFREVHAQTRSPNARLYIARCLQQNGDIPEAYEEMKATIADASARAEAEPKYARTRDAAAAELALLAPQVAKIVIAIVDAPEGVSAAVNGRTIAIGRPVAVSPGTVNVVVRADGKAEVMRELDVAAGTTKTVALTLIDAEKDQPAPTVGPQHSPSFWSTVRIAGIGVAALGGFGVAVFAITASAAKSEFDDLVNLCNDMPCPDSEAVRVADGRTLTTVANVSLAVGAAALVAGAAMIVFGAEEEDELGDPAWLNVSPLIGPGHIGLRGTF